METDLTQLDDGELTARVADGDSAAIAELYDRYATPAFSLALKLAGDPHRAADLVQRAFTRIWADARRLDEAQVRFATRLLSLVNLLAAAPAPPTPAPAPVKLATGTLCLAPVQVTPGRR